MRRATDQGGLPRCANCGVDIPWRPIVRHGETFCCGGCLQGGPCYCSYDLASLHQPRGWTGQIQGVGASRQSVEARGAGDRQAHR